MTDLLNKVAHNQFPNLLKNGLADEHFSKYFMNIYLAEHLLLTASVSLYSYLLISEMPIISRNTKIMCITTERGVSSELDREILLISDSSFP